jgi:hypothetical protein
MDGAPSGSGGESGASWGNVQFDSGWRTILGAVISCSHGFGRLIVQEIAQMSRRRGDEPDGFLPVARAQCGGGL